MSESISAFQMALRQLEEAGTIAGVNPDVLLMLREPQREFIVRFPVVMDNGNTKLFKGLRVQHNHALGPTRGGTRFHPLETLEDIKALALWMTVKNALNGVPAGGGKGGVVCDPSTLSKREKERVCRGYIRAIAPIIGTWTDFPGADIGTDPEMMSWMLDEWEQIHGLRHEPAAISGKSIILGGSEGRPQATGLGVLFSVRQACRIISQPLKGARFAIQGYGKVGSWSAKLLQESGAVLVAVSDFAGCITNRQGIDAFQLDEFVKKNGTIVGYPKAMPLDSRDDLLDIECEIFIPAAIQSTITIDNCDRIKAKVIAEGANGPLTPKAELRMLSKNVFIVPDILANSGGTWIGHLERVQSLQNISWTEQEVISRYEDVFIHNFADVYEIAKTRGISMRLGAWIKALNIIQKAITARGWL